MSGLIKLGYDGYELSLLDAFYRVSIKGIIKDDAGRVLVIKTKYEDLPERWEVPGGGWDFADENIEQVLARELQEEMGLSLKSVDKKPLGLWRVQSHNDSKNILMIKIAYVVAVEATEPILGEDYLAYAYVDREEFVKLNFHPNEAGALDLIDQIFD